jgi:radical SAM protein with 4Fe4S-binding SPASM domain
LLVLRDRKGRLPERCRGCRFLDVCNGNLRTRAESATGDWMGIDPSCYLTAAEMGEVLNTEPA